MTEEDSSLAGEHYPMTIEMVPELAARVGQYQPSEVRQIFARASEPGMLSLAGGSPSLASIPWQNLNPIWDGLIRKYGERFLRYSFGAGISETKAAIVEVMHAERIEAGQTNVVVTVGSQMGLEAISKITVNPGDVVLAEGPSFSGGLAAILSYEAEVWHVPVDSDGLDVVAAQRLIERAKSEGRRIAYLYCIPNFQNPSGSVLSASRRRELIDLCRRADVLIIEDNPYGMLSFDGSTAPSLLNMNPEGVIYLGTFSKTFAPGLRMGWVVAPRRLLQAVIDTVETMILNPPVINQMLMVEIVRSGMWTDHVSAMRDVYSEKAAALTEALRSRMASQIEFDHPSGGFYTWLTLKDRGADSREVVNAALDRGLAVVAGSAFYAGGDHAGGKRQIRLSFSLPSVDEFSSAVGVLAEAVEAVVGRPSRESGT